MNTEIPIGIFMDTDTDFGIFGNSTPIPASKYFNFKLKFLFEMILLT
jgi:hypothetical protein